MWRGQPTLALLNLIGTVKKESKMRPPSPTANVLGEYIRKPRLLSTTHLQLYLNNCFLNESTYSQ